MIWEPNTCIEGDALAVLQELPDSIAQCCVTSPPYFGLRSYLKAIDKNKALELGTEKSPDEYIRKMVEVFREVRRVLKKNGTLWLNLGDCYSTGSGGQNGGNASTLAGRTNGATWQEGNNSRSQLPGIPPKNLLLKPCILAGSRPGDIVMDPFLGSGTTGEVAQELGRKWLGIDLDPKNQKLISERTIQTGMVI